MSDIASELRRFAQQIDVDYNYHLKIENNNKAYVRSIENTCKDNAEMAKEILKHTNSFYIKQDNSPRKGSQKDKPYNICEVCIDDPLVRSEMNLRREMVQYDLIRQGFDINEVRIIPAKGGMKQRHPFSEEAGVAYERIKDRQNIDIHGDDHSKIGDVKQKVSIENLEIVKRVLCKVFKEDAADVVDKINVVILDYVPTKHTNKRGRSAVFYRLRFYSTDDYIRDILEQNKCFIMSVAYTLQLDVRYVEVYKAKQDMITLKAFPKNANPVPYRTNSDEK